MFSHRLHRTISAPLVCLLLAQSCPAQQAATDWQRVLNLTPGTGLVVQIRTGTRYHGELRATTADSVSIDSDERGAPGRAIRRRDIARADIKEVRLFSRTGSRFASAGIGAAAGAGLGLAVDLSAKSKEDRGLATFLFVVLGAVGGWLIGGHSTLVKGERIYVAP